MSAVKSSLRYSAEHEWIDASSPAKIGISQVAADALGDVVYVDVPEAGTAVTAGQTCGEVESTKSVSDLYSPVTGTIVEVNQAAIDDPSLLNSDPYGEGWIIKIKPVNAADVDGLLDAAAYTAKIGA